jgi:hypothetical protein
MKCNICCTSEDIKNDIIVRNIPLYTIGSEGTNLCHQCEMIVVKFLRHMRIIASVGFQRGYKANTCKLTHGGGITKT